MTGILFDELDAQFSHVSSEDSRIRRTVLPNGLRILTENVPGAKSVSLGYWFAVGSRDEAEVGEGSTHFLEHLLFKSTKTRSPLEISQTFDAIGADHNAATAHEYTCYFAHLRGDDLPIAIEVLSDMVTSALLKPEEFETERQVIIEELAMSDDDPADAAMTRFIPAVLGDHPISKPIGGTIDTITHADRDAVWAHYQQNYRPEELVIIAAGQVDHESFVNQVQEELKRGGWSFDHEAAPATRRSTAAATTTMTNPVSIVERPIEQVNFFVGTPGINFVDDRRYAISLLAATLGGGMSSRLFQEVRENNGLAYAVNAFHQSFSDVGIFSTYAGTTTKNMLPALDLILKEFDKVRESAITTEELELVRGQHIGALALRSESMSWRMNRLAFAELRSGIFYDYEESVALIQGVTLDEVVDVSQEIFSKSFAISAVGNINSEMAQEISQRFQ